MGQAIFIFCAWFQESANNRKIFKKYHQNDRGQWRILQTWNIATGGGEQGVQTQQDRHAHMESTRETTIGRGSLKDRMLEKVEGIFCSNSASKILIAHAQLAICGHRKFDSLMPHIGIHYFPIDIALGWVWTISAITLERLGRFSSSNQFCKVH